MDKLGKAVFLIVFVLCVSALRAEQIIDTEKIIDVEKLKAALDEATGPISTRLYQSKILQQYKVVNELLGEEEVSKEDLLRELHNLKREIDVFTINFSEVTDPLWEAEDKIGDTVNQVRLVLARGDSGEPTEKVKSLLRTYDQRLTDLAKRIQREKNADRKRRLKVVFANVLSLRDLVEKSGSIALGPASESVNVKIVRSLMNLELVLTNATFALERSRVVLEGQSEWIGTYCDILGGLIESENLVAVLAEMNTAGGGLGTLNQDIGQLSRLSERFTKAMDEFASRLAGQIESQTIGMVDIPQISDVDIEEKIKEYASRKTEAPHTNKSGEKR